LYYGHCAFSYFFLQYLVYVVGRFWIEREVEKRFWIERDVEEQLWIEREMEEWVGIERDNLFWNERVSVVWERNKFNKIFEINEPIVGIGRDNLFWKLIA